MKNFLPLSKADTKTDFDFICVTGDAYVDHPSFGIAIVSRVLEDMGFSVGIIAAPDMNSDDFLTFGRPKHGFFVTSGNIDSMVCNYTAAKKKRSDDPYLPGGKAGRPDRALNVYCQKIREIYGDVFIVIGGLEASLRRFAHYDYWADRVLPSVLSDTQADILVYGMGERQTREIARRLFEGDKQIDNVKGTAVFAFSNAGLKGIELPSYKKVCEDKIAYAKAAKVQLSEHEHINGKRLFQSHGDKTLVVNPPAAPLEREEFDAVYALPYTRMYHPYYEQFGGIPAIEEVEFSVTHNRGCFGACNFCSLAFHQGKSVRSRSEESVLKECEELVKNPRFKGYIHDIGGPTANFRHSACKKQTGKGACTDKRCLSPDSCKNLFVDHSEYLSLLRKIRKIKGVKKVFIRSGIRYDYLLKDKDDSFFRDLVKHHISGQLKVAPEHSDSQVLSLMGKPYINVYKQFADKYKKLCSDMKKDQYLVPYFMSSHPGATLKSAIDLALFLKENNIRPRQVQDFYPTPGTMSTAMYYTGLNPYTMKPVYVAYTAEEKAMQRALLQYFLPENRDMVVKALKKAGREDLKNILIPSVGTPTGRPHKRNIYAGLNGHPVGVPTKRNNKK